MAGDEILSEVIGGKLRYDPTVTREGGSLASSGDYVLESAFVET